MELIDCLKYPGTRLTVTGCEKYATANPEKCAGCSRNDREKPTTGICIKCKRPRKIVAKGECGGCYNKKYAGKQNARAKELRAAGKAKTVVTEMGKESRVPAIVINLHVTAGDAARILDALRPLIGGAA